MWLTRCVPCMPFPMEGCGCSGKTQYSSPSLAANFSPYHFISLEKSCLAGLVFIAFITKFCPIFICICHILPNTSCVPCHRLTLPSDLAFPLGMLQCSRWGFCQFLCQTMLRIYCFIDSLFFTCILHISSLIHGYQKHIHQPAGSFGLSQTLCCPASFFSHH